METIVDLPEVVDASVGPRGSLELLSQSAATVTGLLRIPEPVKEVSPS